jgi:hypothetical protein
MKEESVARAHNLLSSAGVGLGDAGLYGLMSKKSLNDAINRISQQASSIQQSLSKMGAISVSPDAEESSDASSVAIGRTLSDKEGLRNYWQKKIMNRLGDGGIYQLPGKMAFLIAGGFADFVL